MAAQTLSLCARALPCEVLVPSFSNERVPDNKLGPTNVVFLSLTSGGRPFYYILLQYKVAMCPFSVSIAAIKATVSFTF